MNDESNDADDDETPEQIEVLIDEESVFVVVDDEYAFLVSPEYAEALADALIEASKTLRAQRAVSDAVGAMRRKEQPS